ncbi:MAG: signal peptide peptidase SppA [Pseudomonadales bacterium]
MAYDGNPYNALGDSTSSNDPTPGTIAPAQPRKKGFWGSLGGILSTLRTFTANLLFLVFLLIVLSVLLRGCQHTQMPGGGALLLNPQGAVVEQPALGNPLQGLLNPQMAVTETALADLLRAIDHGADDARISMLVMRLDSLSWLSLTHAQTLGAALTRFKESGKQVVAYGYFFDQVPYLLASYADAVYMHPMGQALLPGFERFGLYFKDLIDKLKINLHVFRVGTYKSFVEPYERNSMSAAAREANSETLSSLWRTFTRTVASNRQIEPSALAGYVQAFPDAVAATTGDLARAALEANLVDELLSEDELRARIADTTGRDDQGDFVATDYRDYLLAIDAQPLPVAPYVSLVTLDGTILMSSDSGGDIAADRTSELLRSVANDPDAAALVVRVDSPGGSSFASELIRKELELIQLAGKPVVISMGNTAASGGYWISATADAIVAEPTTITGSIGIFSLIPTFEQSLDAIGVTSDGVGTTPLSGTFSLVRGIDEPMQQVLQGTLEHGYEQFINLVARGRDMTPEQVDAVAQGRIWTGERALELGLVDLLGDVATATAHAAELAALTSVNVKRVAPQPSARDLLLQRLLNNSAGQAGLAAISEGLSPLSSLPSQTPLTAQWLQWQQRIETLARMQDPNHHYVLCEFCEGLTGPSW